MKDENSPKGFRGYCIDLMDEIARMSNFDYVVYEVEDKIFGGMNDDGTWTGVLSELVYRRADMSFPINYIMYDRSLVVDYTVPITDLSGLTIMMKRTPKERSLFQFVTVLEWKVWLCIFFSFWTIRCPTCCIITKKNEL